jgi:uncharacterized protein (DUF305 family)
MMRSSVLPTAIRRAGLLAGAAVGAVVLLSACGGDNSSDTGMNRGEMMPSTATSSATFNDADVAFAQNMIPHHQQAVQMAAMATEHASDGQVKQLAAGIKQAQQPEIDTMNEWLTTWGAPTAGGAMSSAMPGMSSAMPNMQHGAMPGMMSDADMAKLDAAHGTAFDKRFLTMMISHHEGAITMAKEEVAKGANPDATALAQKIIKDQQTEITTMKGILDRL